MLRPFKGTSRPHLFFIKDRLLINTGVRVYFPRARPTFVRRPCGTAAARWERHSKCAPIPRQPDSTSPISRSMSAARANTNAQALDKVEGALSPLFCPNLVQIEHG